MDIVPFPKLRNVHVYLAGPDVFKPDAADIGKRKKIELRRRGMQGYFQLDNALSPQKAETPQQFADRIAANNEALMRKCCKDGQIGIILANMSPWHGSPSMDVGTAFEMGFMSALADKPNVIIIGYYDDEKDHQLDFAQRVKKMVYGGRGLSQSALGLRGPDKNLIEDFGNHENLMIDHAVRKSGGVICPSFETAVQAAQDLSQKREARLAETDWQHRIASNENKPEKQR